MSNGPELNFDDLLNEIEAGSSGSVASVLCKIRNHEEYLFTNGRGAPVGELAASFADAITTRISMKNDDIQRACSAHSKSFVETTRELIEIQSETQEIETSLKEVGNDFRNSVGFLDEVFSQLTEHKSSLESIEKTIEALELSIPILEMYGSIRDSIKNKRQYHALKSLSNLEKNKLPLIRKYAFASAIEERIPLLRAEIKNSSLKEVTNFLEIIRSKSIEIGEIAMRQTAIVNGFIINDTKFNTKIDKTLTPDALIDRKVSITNNIINLNALISNNLISGWSYSSKNNIDIEVEELRNLFKTYRPFDGQLSDSENANPNLSVLDSILDFTSVYRCMHIHSVLHEKIEFEKNYCTQRKKQLTITLSLSARQEKETENYLEFYSSIVGFFKVEECLRHTLSSPSAIFQAHIEENWNTACTKLTKFVENNSSNEKHSLADIIRLKDYTELFIRTMMSIGFSTTGLSDLIDIIRKKYVELLSNEYTKKFEKIFEEDNYTLITIKSNMDYDIYLSHYPIEDQSDHYPKTLDYSLMVPKVFYEITQFVLVCKDFNQNIDISLTEIEDNINRAVNSLILENLNYSLNLLIKYAQTDLNKLVLLCLNMSEYEKMCRFVGSFIDNCLSPDTKLPSKGSPTGESPMSPVVPRPKVAIETAEKFKKATGIQTQVSGMESWNQMLERSSILGLKTKLTSEIDLVNAQFTIDCSRMFRNNRTVCEESIYDMLTQKVNGFIELTQYPGINGDLTKENTSQIQPSNQINEMFTWLKTNFNAFNHLPAKVAQTACITVCKHIDKQLLDILIGDDVKSITGSTIDQISCDLKLCIQFAKSGVVTGIVTSDLIMLFKDLEQLTNLYYKRDWSTYIELYGSVKNTDYDRVKPDQCIKLLERLREGKASGLRSFLNREDRELKKNYDEIIRRLKEKKVSGFERTQEHS